MISQKDLERARELLGQAQQLLGGEGSSVDPGSAHEEPTGKLVCIDAGHGGHDSGAVSANGSTEKAIVLQYALTLGTALARLNFRTMFTRIEDKFIPLSDRADIANKAGAEAFVSLHANSAESKLANGAWVIYDDKSPTKGKVLAETVFNRLLSIPGIADIDKNRDVYPDGSPWVGNRQLTVISKASMPAILVELGFMTNEEDFAQLNNGVVRVDVCNAIAFGIQSWFTSNGR